MVSERRKNKQEDANPKCLQHLIDQDSKWVPQKLSLSKFDKVLLLSPIADETMTELVPKMSQKIPTETGYLDSKVIIPLGWKVGWKKWKVIPPSVSSAFDEYVHFGLWFSMWIQDDVDAEDYVALKQYCSPPLKRMVDGKEVRMDSCRMVSIDASKLVFFADYTYKDRDE